MAYRELSMIQVKEVLRRWQAGHGERKIGRETGVNRKTVGRYIHWALELGVERTGELTDGDIHAVAQCVQSRPVCERSPEWCAVVAHREAIEEWLSRKPPLRLSKIHTLLTRRGVDVSYATLRRYAMQELGWRKKKATMRLEDPPAGQEAQIDFGRMGYIVDSETGKRRTVWVLIVTLSHSRYQFVWPTFLQTTEAICEGLDAAWSFFGAMPTTLLPDNMTGIVKKSDALNPELCEAFLDYVQVRNLFVDPARVRHPKDKARVENQVAYVRESWFAGEEFSDLDDMRRSAAQWCAETAGGRIHGTTRQVPREVFEAVERPVMQPAPSEPFDVPHWAKATVHPDYHIQLLRALYSVPWPYLGKEVRARADKKLVKIYIGTELIKLHARKLPGGRSTDVNDYPPEKQGYALRSVDRVLGQARARGPHIGQYVERIVAGPLPWARMRSAYALLRLCDKFGAERVDAVCQSALAFDVIDVYRIKRMLQAGVHPPTATGSNGCTGTVAQLTPRFARDAKQFETRARTAKGEGQ